MEFQRYRKSLLFVFVFFFFVDGFVIFVDLLFERDLLFDYVFQVCNEILDVLVDKEPIDGFQLGLVESSFLFLLGQVVVEELAVFRLALASLLASL